MNLPSLPLCGDFLTQTSQLSNPKSPAGFRPTHFFVAVEPCWVILKDKEPQNSNGRRWGFQRIGTVPGVVGLSMRVCIYDENEQDRNAACDALGEAGYTTSGASTLEALEELLRTDPPDLAVVSPTRSTAAIQEVIVRLRQEHCVSIPMVLYTEHDMGGDETCAEGLCSVAFIRKKNGPAELVAQVDELAQLLRSPMPKVNSQELGAKAPVTGRTRVLIVDDHAMTAKLLAAELQGTQLEVLTANSAEEATGLIIKQATRPDLVILDVYMPGIDGEKLCRFIKTNQLFDSIKVVLCSCMEEDRLKILAEACQADGYVCKNSVLGKWIMAQLE